MTLIELNNYFNSFLKKEDYASDMSLNGIQIQNKEPDSKQITKVAFAVDACETTAKIAAEQGAQALFVHHGLLWGQCQTITGSFYKRIATFINNDLALIGYHIPLDANNPYGNNYGLAARLELTELEDFGTWRGMNIGVKGELPTELTINQIAQKLLRPGKLPPVVIPAGKEKIKTVAIVSGGGSDDVMDAISQNVDLFITGEFAHEHFHYAKEAGINVIGGGHYETETVGVSLVMQKLQADHPGIECIFIDEPTGL